MLCSVPPPPGLYVVRVSQAVVFERLQHCSWLHALSVPQRRSVSCTSELEIKHLEWTDPTRPDPTRSERFCHRDRNELGHRAVGEPLRCAALLWLCVRVALGAE